MTPPRKYAAEAYACPICKKPKQPRNLACSRKCGALLRKHRTRDLLAGLAQERAEYGTPWPVLARRTGYVPMSLARTLARHGFDGSADAFREARHERAESEAVA